MLTYLQGNCTWRMLLAFLCTAWWTWYKEKEMLNKPHNFLYATKEFLTAFLLLVFMHRREANLKYRTDIISIVSSLIIIFHTTQYTEWKKEMWVKLNSRNIYIDIVRISFIFGRFSIIPNFIWFLLDRNSLPLKNTVYNLKISQNAKIFLSNSFIFKNINVLTKAS